jgi:alpha-N-arabinofuranosidase
MRDTRHSAFAGRRLRHRNWAFSAAIEFAPQTAGETAGIILLQSEDWQYRFELFLAGGRPALRLIRAAGSGKEEEIIATGDFPPARQQGAAILEARCEGTALSFWYGTGPGPLKPFADGADGRILSPEYSGGFTGTLAGVFASGNGADTGNCADILWAEYTEL